MPPGLNSHDVLHSSCNGFDLGSRAEDRTHPIGELPSPISPIPRTARRTELVLRSIRSSMVAVPTRVATQRREPDSGPPRRESLETDDRKIPKGYRRTPSRLVRGRLDDAWTTTSGKQVIPIRQVRVQRHGRVNARHRRRIGDLRERDPRSTTHQMRNGKSRVRRPVRRACAFAIAGGTGGTPGSPIPTGRSVDGTRSTTTSGISEILNIG